MGWTESKRKSNKELIQAIKALRAHVGDTQEEFAAKLALSKRAIANYEKDRRPTVAVLARLAGMASDTGLGKETRTFMQELGEDLGLDQIIVGLISADASSENPRGFMILHIDGKEARTYTRAFLDTFARFMAGDVRSKGLARGLLNNFSTAATKTWKQIPSGIGTERWQL